mmetsp:Transcript_20352/g.68278  ORF Transcript_20352/g.68278 Transcript_20352/m.68278 type:complete len:219 (+) Transcript_20352:221-877(+)
MVRRMCAHLAPGPQPGGPLAVWGALLVARVPRLLPQVAHAHDPPDQAHDHHRLCARPRRARILLGGSGARPQRQAAHRGALRALPALRGGSGAPPGRVGRRGLPPGPRRGPGVAGEGPARRQPRGRAGARARVRPRARGAVPAAQGGPIQHGLLGPRRGARELHPPGAFRRGRARERRRAPPSALGLRGRPPVPGHVCAAPGRLRGRGRSRRPRRRGR